jgi:peptidoglycan-associated lipoprotein
LAKTIGEMSAQRQTNARRETKNLTIFFFLSYSKVCIILAVFKIIWKSYFNLLKGAFMKIRSLLVLIVLAASMALTSCASNKKKSTEAVDNTAADTTLENGKNNGMNLELNGDSDSNKAGALKTVYFDYSSATIGGETKETLNSNADFLKKNTTVKVQVEGHCDERGSVQFNLALGEKRAKSVRDYLVAQGVAAGRITVISLGKEKPVSFGHDEESWSKNRRANFVVTEK